MSFFESEIKSKNEIHLIGLDEVGRGPLAGPVVSCATSFRGSERELKLLLKELDKYQVTDSKNLSEKKRKQILDLLKIDVHKLSCNQVVKRTLNGINFQWSLCEIDNLEIDEINILQASLLSMGKAALNIGVNQKTLCWVDGNKEPPLLKNIPGLRTIVKGDSKSAFIALASIIAKEYRDLLMEKYGKEFPEYGFEAHSGYPTKKHKEAIEKWGITPLHRKTFKGVKEFLPN